MKKILPFILLAGIGFLAYSCDNNDDVVVQNPVDNDTFPIMNDATGTFSASDSYTLTADINIQSTDVVLVYRRDAGVWQQIPKTVYVDAPTSPSARRFEYNFVFDTKAVEVRIDNANFTLSSMSSAEAGKYLNIQTFRIVLVPADQGKNSSNMAKKVNGVDYSDYNAVVKYYNLDESKIKTINAR